jgi:hypothetical protein
MEQFLLFFYLVTGFLTAMVISVLMLCFSNFYGDFSVFQITVI